MIDDIRLMRRVWTGYTSEQVGQYGIIYHDTDDMENVYVHYAKLTNLHEESITFHSAKDIDGAIKALKKLRKRLKPYIWRSKEEMGNDSDAA